MEKLRDERIEKLQAYVATPDSSRVEILRSCGFEKEALMRGQLQIGNAKIGLEIYSKSIYKVDET